MTGDGQTVTVPADGTATATITDTYTEANGSLIVNKTIDGPAAGQQGEIVIQVSCDGNALEDFVIPAGRDWHHIRRTTGTSRPGHNAPSLRRPMAALATVAVANKGSGTVVTIPAGAEATVDLTDTYESGALVVNKTITGPAAGSQGEVRIAVSCNERTQTSPDFEIPTGTAGTVSMSYPNVLAGSTCASDRDGQRRHGDGHGRDRRQPPGSHHLGERDGHRQRGQHVQLRAWRFGRDERYRRPGRRPAGPGFHRRQLCTRTARRQALDPFVIPAGHAAGIVSHTYEGIPAGSTCTVTETQDGSTSTVSVETVGGNQTLVRPRPDRSRSQHHGHLLLGPAGAG